MQLTFSSVEDIVTRPRFASKIDKPEYLQLRHSRLSLNANLMAEFEYERERESSMIQFSRSDKERGDSRDKWTFPEVHRVCEW